MVEPKKEATLGILVGGGPAPGINGVISAVTIRARKLGLKVYGIYDGYKWLAFGDETAFKKNIRELRISDVSRIHYDGGSILRTSRTNPAKEKNGTANAVKMLKSLGIEYMVTIGGDDTSYGASEIAKEAKGSIKFAHVPKTIDNDLPLPNHIPTFGYQTAREVGSQLVKNLMEDARTSNRWYIVVAMGRSAGHLALGIAKSAGATVAIIPEEFGAASEKKVPLRNVCDIFETAIIKRRAMGHEHGVLVLAEGVSDRLDEEDLNKASGGKIKRDSFGNLVLADVDLGRVIKLEIEKRFEEREEKFRTVTIDLGYVLRCADPVPFDQDYTRDLGYHAVGYLLSKEPEHQKNALICSDHGKLIPMYFDDILDPVTKKTKIRLVDLSSSSYKIARSYMVRLEKADIEEEAFLASMSAIARITPSDFKDRYRYLVSHSE